MPLAPTTNMQIVKPEPGVTVGPEWAQTLNEALDNIDEHDHTSDKGKRVPSAGINIDADLEFNSHDATELRSARLESQSGALVDPSDIGCLYRVGDNLYYNNSSGTAVQITSGTAVASSVSGAFTAVTPGGYPYSVTSGNAQNVLLVATSAARTINLPAATTAILFAIKDISGLAATNNISVVPNGTNQIEGVAATYLLNKNNGWWFFISNGLDAWYVAECVPQAEAAGIIKLFGGSVVPSGHLLCNGAAVSRTTYARLFTAIGTAHGVGDGSTTFNLPDMRQRFPLGVAASGTGNALGGTGGAIDHTHTVPAHYHGMGTGADLAIGSSGSHTHSIDHDHGSVTSGGSGTLTTGTDGAHRHLIAKDGVSSTTMTSGNQMSRSYDATNDFSYDIKASASDADVGRTSSAGDHTHDISSHTHSVDLPNFTGTSGSTAHTHASGDITGRIGLVTGGVNGNAAMTSGSNNPPFVALNFIITT